MEHIITVLLSVVASAGMTWFINDRTSRHIYMAESAAKKLLMTAGWSKRSFLQIKERIGGFEDDQLRQILVRAGALRFKGKGHGDDSELWGLISRNPIE